MNHIVVSEPFANVRSAQQAWFYEIPKRCIDILVAQAGILIGWPVWLAFALLIKLTSPGPILYTTESLGKHARPFKLFKFRTMRAGNDETVHDDYLANYVNGEPYSVVKDKHGREKKVYKIVHDKRVTRIGRFLRSTGLDEAPQFINVLKGEMSMVGPRPPRPAEYVHYQEWHKQRLSVIPGITGLYEVTARCEVPFDEMVRIDLEYIRKRSLWLDLKIMLLTPINVILLRRGGY